MDTERPEPRTITTAQIVARYVLKMYALLEQYPGPCEGVHRDADLIADECLAALGAQELCRAWDQVAAARDFWYA